VSLLCTSFFRTSLLSAAALTGLSAALTAAPLTSRVTLSGHVPALASVSEPMNPTAASVQISLAISLPLRNQSTLQQNLQDLYNPKSVHYHHYLTPQQFALTYGPTQANYNKVIAWARSQRLTVTGIHPEHTLLDVSGPASRVEGAFGVQLYDYISPSGRSFHAPLSEPSLPASVAGVVRGVVGLNNAAVAFPNLTKKPVTSVLEGKSAGAGTGPGGGLTPKDIRTAYGLDNTGLDGSGQVLAVYELDSYTSRDILRYERAFGLPIVPLENILVDKTDPMFPSKPGGGTGEVVLDIDMQIALAPKAAKMLVYIAPNTPQGGVDCYQQIASDGIATSVSTSWGLWEDNLIGIDPTTGYPAVSAVAGIENQIFYQMALQGQTLFSAAGDYGGVDPYAGSPTAYFAQDPAAQPLVCGVGGTSLTVANPGVDEHYVSETTWNADGKYLDGAGGGGVSIFWPIPSYQKPAAALAGAVAPGGSSVSQYARNVPDVSLNSDPATGYSIYVTDPKTGPKYYVYGGTSCAAPLWAGFSALVNQSRAQVGSGPIGFINFALYSLFTDANSNVLPSYFNDFNDIADGSNNIPYPAIPGYDLATGLGTFQGGNLLADLTLFP
jgi:subtilase family serine protease